MATAREEPPTGRNNPYETGGGGFGKFRKKPFRRSHQSTPYDRPSTAIRNPIASNGSFGWLSKLVDPAQRLITSSAHRLFASVFRKRLPAPPTPSPSPSTQPSVETEVDHDEARDNKQEPFVSDPTGLLEGPTNGSDKPSTSSDHGGLVELEKILRHKTFTRSEIDRLTTLLHSRTVDLPMGNKEKRSEVIPVKQMTTCDRADEFPKSLVKENGTESHFASTPAINLNVLDDDIASPAELAKAYMGTVPSKVSPSMLGLRSQALREDSAVLSSRPNLSKSPILAVVPRSSAHVGFIENGYVTPRSRGRSAIYSMARTPYARVQSPASSKGVGPAIDVSYAPLSSQSAWEQNRLSGSRQGALKRRSSFLDNDIGSVGPMRRIRQKSNLLPSKNLSLPLSRAPVSMHGTDIDSERPSSSKQKPVSLGEIKHGFTKVSAENGVNSSPGTSFTPVPSKTSEVAMRILEQLDKLVSSKDKSPSKLSPSMLHGPALKSLENIDSSHVLENALGNNKMDSDLGASLPDARDSTLQKQSKVEENGPTNSIALRGKLASAMNGTQTTDLAKDILPGVRITDSGVMNSVTYQHSQKKRAFQMSAHEDYLDLDDEDHSNGVTAAPLAEGREKLDSVVMENKDINSGAFTMEKPPASLEAVPSSTSVLNKKAAQIPSDEAAGAGKTVGFSFSAVTSSSAAVQPAFVATKLASISDKATLLKESNAIPVKFVNEDKDALPKEQSSVIPTVSHSSKNVDVVSPFTFMSSSTAVGEALGPEVTASSDSKAVSSVSFPSVAGGATDSVPKVPNSDKIAPKNGVFIRTSESSLPSAVSTSSASSTFAFGGPPSSSSFNNGSIASIPSSFSSDIPPLVYSNVTSGSSGSSSSSAIGTSDKAVNINSNSSLSTSSAMPSVTATPIFKFGSPVVPLTSTPLKSVASSAESAETKTKETSFGNLTSTPFGGTPSVSANTGSSIFGTASAAVTGTGSSIFGGTSSVITSAGSSVFGGTSSAITSAGSSIFGGTSAANPNNCSAVFGGTSSAITNTGSNLFGGTTAAISSTGGSIFAFGAAASSAATSQSEGSAPCTAGNAQGTAAGAGFASLTQSMPIQFASSTSSPSFGLASSAAFSSAGSPVGSSSSTANLFSSGTAFGSSFTAPSIVANSFSSSASTASGLVGSNWQAPKSPVFGSTFSSASLSTGFAFGASSASVDATNSAPPLFGSSMGTSSSSVFPFSSAAATSSSQPVFGSANPSFSFSSSALGNNNDQMSMEDSMAEDTVQGATPTVSVFGQQTMSTPSSFVFGSTASGANPYQFGGQQNLANPHNQNPTPFQASGSLEFNAGGTGSFSLGSGGGDKANRRIVKVNRNKQRKK